MDRSVYFVTDYLGFLTFICLQSGSFLVAAVTIVFQSDFGENTGNDLTRIPSLAPSDRDRGPAYNLGEISSPSRYTGHTSERLSVRLILVDLCIVATGSCQLFVSTTNSGLHRQQFVSCH
ncbi:hypothetical protein FB567DRAFT_518475 [Paraphoma chrysanthemicola]|uniref:Uncharacterized protein n=1 Tax=Paraphoma chrysanthemicola TaxID=798071 RepID=A0A8K0RF71_9PLEO|nr:hypothetical protein FB567DRAFT_518475 [Paraphoma chrysanthemicola]